MFAIVTDSTVYLTRSEAEALGARLCVLPMTYDVSGMAFSEGFLDENGRFAELVERNIAHMHTAQVPVSAFSGAFHDAVLAGMEVLCVTMSSRLSGTYANALLAAREMGGDRIRVVDSLSTAAGMRFLVEEACALSREGIPLAEAAARLEDMRGRIGTALSVDDMDALQRSGRLGSVRLSTSTILNVRPVLRLIEGAVVSDGIARGAQAQIEALVSRIPRNAKQIIVQYILHRPIAMALAKAVRDAFACPVRLCGIGPVVAVHVGVGMIGVAWMS